MAISLSLLISLPGANELGWKQIGRRVVISALWLTLAGCSREPLQHYPIEGTVVSVEANVHEVTLNHKAIPGFMEAMTMNYAVKDEDEFAKLKPGDEIKADLVVNRQEGRVWLQHIQVTKAGSGARPPSPTETSLPNFGKKFPSFRLINQDGRSVTSANLRNQALVITFVYTRCPFSDMCPLLNRNFAQLATVLQLNASRYPPTHLLSVSLDPEFDQPAVLRDYAKRLGRRGSDWDFVTGTPDEIRRLAEFCGVSYWKEQGVVTHSMMTVIVSPQGNLAHAYHGNGWQIETVLDDLKSDRR